VGLTRCLTGAFLLVVSGCAEDRTEVIVVVDSDIRVPDDMDEIVVEAEGPESDTFLRRAVAALGEDEPPLPRTLGLVHQGGPLGPFSVEVLGKRGGGTVVRRSAEVYFQPQRTLVLPLHLIRACQGVVCPFEETCAEDGCRPIAIDSDELEGWGGSPPRLGPTDFDAGGSADGGPVDAGLPTGG
jgi:hypothetical protein